VSGDGGELVSFRQHELKVFDAGAVGVVGRDLPELAEERIALEQGPLALALVSDESQPPS